MRLIHKKITSDDAGPNFVLSDATIDRYGDSIDPRGWDLDTFKSNPIALFNHNPDFPIGRWDNLAVRDGALRGRLRMAPVGTSQRLDEIHRLVGAGILKAVSVGFRPIESQPRGTKGVNYLKQELLETSLVSVPANPNALLTAKSLGVSERTIDLIFEGQNDPAALAARKARAKRVIAEARRVLRSVERQRAEWTRSKKSTPSTDHDQRVGAALDRIDQETERRVREQRVARERGLALDEQARLHMILDPDQRSARFAELKPLAPTKSKKRRPGWPAPE